jgi:hypothetical protein
MRSLREVAPGVYNKRVLKVLFLHPSSTQRATRALIEASALLMERYARQVYDQHRRKGNTSHVKTT